MSKKTVFVAVHGIGDQVKYSTVQAVARRVYAHEKKSFSLSLGAFHSSLENEETFFPGLNTTAFGDVGFAEVHWADVPREAVDGYTLQETRKWADMLAERIRDRHERLEAEGQRPPKVSYDLIQQVLKEIRDTLTVTDRVLSLAKKANLGEFNLKKILDDFLGDVQFVAEFKLIREQILARFNKVLEQVGSEPETDIVIIAHSEGTVVAMLGLLLAAVRKDAAGVDAPPPWLEKVTALMTIGSPIDKHLLLWPELWGELKNPPERAAPPIVWWNYYDHGDPVGFELEDARDWLTDNGFMGTLFQFTPDHDCGYTRSLFPGKAHVDYWSDQSVFHHFLSAIAPAGPRAKKPRSKPLIALGSYFLPYVVVAGIMLLAVYCVSLGALKAKLHGGDAFRELVGFACLLAGTTVFARMLRLARLMRWRLVAFLVFLASFVAYMFLVLDHNKPSMPGLRVTIPWLFGDGSCDLGIVAFLVSLLSRLVSEVKPQWGMRPLVVIGSVAVAVAVWFSPSPTAPPETSTVWPLLLGTAAFLYLWWYAALLFDLTFVWHRYVRHSVEGMRRGR